jgi:enterochelin esterase-like enzyme
LLRLPVEVMAVGGEEAVTVSCAARYFTVIITIFIEWNDRLCFRRDSRYVVAIGNHDGETMRLPAFQQIGRIAGLGALFALSGVAAAGDGAFPDCSGGTDPGPCYVKQGLPDRSRLPAAGPAAWIDGNRLVISWVGKAETVRLSGSVLMHTPLTSYENDIHQTVIQSAEVPRLRTGLNFVVTHNGKAERVPQRIEVAGPAAAPASLPAPSDPLSMSFEGTALQARVWLPPGYKQGQRYPIIYLADAGRAVPGEALSESIVKGEIPPVIVAGIDNCVGTATDSTCRGNNYLSDRDAAPSPAFLAYEKTVVGTIIPAIEARFGGPSSPRLRAVGGASNGGVWTASMGLRHPELFGAAFALSPGMQPAQHAEGKPTTRFYLAAGLFEPGFRRTAKQIAEHVNARGGTATVTVFPSGHDGWMWVQAFREGVRDWLSTRPAVVPPAPPGGPTQ